MTNYQSLFHERNGVLGYSLESHYLKMIYHNRIVSTNCSLSRASLNKISTYHPMKMKIRFNFPKVCWAATKDSTLRQRMRVKKTLMWNKHKMKRNLWITTSRTLNGNNFYLTTFLWMLKSSIRKRHKNFESQNYRLYLIALTTNEGRVRKLRCSLIHDWNLNADSISRFARKTTSR